jgi:hypothetical protein
MALSLGDANAVVRRMRGSARSSGVAETIRAFSATLNDVLQNRDIQLVEFANMNSADKVIADVACRILAIYVKKPTASTTDAWFKGSAHATVAAADGDFTMKLVGTGGGGREYFVSFQSGLPMTLGFTIQCHTTVNGSTKSANADCASGFVVLAAA